MKNTAIYPGTFDPITYGHIDVIQKSLKIFDKIIVAISDGNQKNYLFSIDERIQIVNKALFSDLKFNKKNPRPYFLDGQSKYYTPAAFGGGLDIALPLLEKSLKYYDEFEAKPYWPDWGKEDCKFLYDKALNEKE